MKLASIRRWFGILPLGLILLPIQWSEPIPELVAAQFPSTIVMIEGKTVQGFPYLFGGVSSDEREAMEERAKGYNVKLVFAEKRGGFISGVTVVITSAKGTEIVSLKTEGPWFYIQLPPGDYSVKAMFKDETKQIKNLSVPKEKKVQQVLVWRVAESVGDGK